MTTWREWAPGPGRARLAAALRATELRARNWTFDPGAVPCFAIYEEGDTYVGCVEIGEAGNLRIPPADLESWRRLHKRQRLLLEGLIRAWCAIPA